MTKEQIAQQIAKDLAMQKVIEAGRTDLRIRGWIIRDIMVSMAPAGFPGVEMRFYDEMFPILRTDTYEDMLRKYVKQHPEEVAQFVKEMNEYTKVLDDDKGFTKSRNMRIACKLPETLYHITNQYYPEYLENRKGYRKLQSILPKCFIGNL